METGNGQKDVLMDIDAAIEGLKDVERYGMFVRREAECERALQQAMRLLRAMKEVLKG